MAVILSGGTLAGTSSPLYPGARPLLLDGGGITVDPAKLYRTQPAIRTVVDFLARNVAQLGLHVFTRASDTDRVRVHEGELPRLITTPNPWTTKYRWISALVHDLCLWGSAYWLITANPDGRLLVRLRPDQVRVRGDGLTGPSGYTVTYGGTTHEVPPESMVHFRTYSPSGYDVGLSPMETLSGIISEDIAAGAYRESFWKNAARHEGVLSRPTDAPKWSATARTRFREEWEALYTGDLNSGRTAILEEGMTFTPTTFSARDSQYLEARKLTREEVAAAYHIPAPSVGILDHATFSNVKEQHKQLYSDTLGPWLEQITEEIALQLIPRLPDSEGLYVEFNLAEKLRGSFEEQANQLRTSVGAPWLTRNEARALSNLPAIEGGDVLITPLNVTASPDGTAPGSDVATIL